MNDQATFLSGEHFVIPVFVLGLNILPDETLPLHIFEERYKLLLSHCLYEQDTVVQFGVLFSSNEPARYGCSVDIEEVMQEYEDGRADILTRGAKTFEVLQILPEEGFPRAHAKWLETQYDASKKLQSGVLQAVLDFYELIKEPKPFELKGLLREAECSALSVAATVQLDVFERQELLGTFSEQERFLKLLSYIKFRSEIVQRSGTAGLNQMYSE